jgi:hypothetical protein
MILDVSGNRSKMNKLETIENVCHAILRGRCNTILRVSLLAGCLACMVVLVYYVPEIVTGEGTLHDARGLCRDGPCETLLETVYLNAGENYKEVKGVCRRAAFCARRGKWEAAQGFESIFENDVCRDVHCTGTVMLDGEKAQYITLEVGSALMQMFRAEKAAMDAAIVEGDELGYLAGGVFTTKGKHHKGPILQLIEEQLHGSSITLIHWEVLDAVFHRGNDTTLWSDAQIRELLLWTGQWTEEKLKDSTDNSALQRGLIVSKMLSLLQLRISDSKPLSATSTCQDSCEWNGICEDGGVSAATPACNFTTDCMVRMPSLEVGRGEGGGFNGANYLHSVFVQPSWPLNAGLWRPCWRKTGEFNLFF